MLVLRFGGNLKCIFIHELTLLIIFFNCLLLYSIFSISFSQEVQIHHFLHLLLIRSLTVYRNIVIFVHLHKY